MHPPDSRSRLSPTEHAHLIVPASRYRRFARSISNGCLSHAYILGAQCANTPLHPFFAPLAHSVCRQYLYMFGCLLNATHSPNERASARTDNPSPVYLRHQKRPHTHTHKRAPFRKDGARIGIVAAAETGCACVCVCTCRVPSADLAPMGAEYI